VTHDPQLAVGEHCCHHLYGAKTEICGSNSQQVICVHYFLLDRWWLNTVNSFRFFFSSVWRVVRCRTPNCSLEMVRLLDQGMRLNPLAAVSGMYLVSSRTLTALSFSRYFMFAMCQSTHVPRHLFGPNLAERVLPNRTFIQCKSAASQL